MPETSAGPEFGEGGHFAAREQPAALVADVRSFVFADLSLEERPTAPPSPKL